MRGHSPARRPQAPRGTRPRPHSPVERGAGAVIDHLPVALHLQVRIAVVAAVVLELVDGLRGHGGERGAREGERGAGEGGRGPGGRTGPSGARGGRRGLGREERGAGAACTGRRERAPGSGKARRGGGAPSGRGRPEPGGGRGERPRPGRGCSGPGHKGRGRAGSGPGAGRTLTREQSRQARRCRRSLGTVSSAIAPPPPRRRRAGRPGEGAGGTARGIAVRNGRRPRSGARSGPRGPSHGAGTLRCVRGVGRRRLWRRSVQRTKNHASTPGTWINILVNKYISEHISIFTHLCFYRI